MLLFARFSQFDGAKFWIVLFFVTATYRKSHDTFYCLTQDSLYVFLTILLISEWHLHIFYFEPPQKKTTNKPNKDSTKALVYKASDWSGRCLRGGGNIYTSTSFFLPLVFENSSQSFIEYSTVTFEFDPCVLLPTWYHMRVTATLCGACSDIKKWLLNW